MFAISKPMPNPICPFLGRIKGQTGEKLYPESSQIRILYFLLFFGQQFLLPRATFV